ncbi:MAG: hypothetical protein IJ333_07230, partial [Clostridia bacterium]|nr:hypothetical protein [Clostridia bacterium]
TGQLTFFAITAAIGAIGGAVIGGITAAKNGENVWAGIGIGAAVGGLVGLGAGAAAATMLSGSVTASTSLVVAGGATLINTVTTCGLGAGAVYVANNVSQALSGGGGQVVSQTIQTGKNVYYQVTSSQAAQSIANTGELIPSSVERSVCVLNFQPTLAQAQQLGAQSVDTVIRFSTNCTTFINDSTVPFTGAYRNMIDGAIRIFDVIEVGFR